MSAGRGAFAGSVLVASSALTTALCLARAWVASPLPLLVGAAWLLCMALPRVRLSGGCFAIMLCGSAAGLLAGLPAPLLLLVSLASLAAWDLEALVRSTRGAADPHAARLAARAHVIRLVLVLAVGALLGAAALLLRVSIGFAALLGIAAILAVSLGVLTRRLSRAAAVENPDGRTNH